MNAEVVDDAKVLVAGRDDSLIPGHGVLVATPEPLDVGAELVVGEEETGDDAVEEIAKGGLSSTRDRVASLGVPGLVFARFGSGEFGEAVRTVVAFWIADHSEEQRVALGADPGNGVEEEVVGGRLVEGDEAPTDVLALISKEFVAVQDESESDESGRECALDTEARADLEARSKGAELGLGEPFAEDFTRSLPNVFEGLGELVGGPCEPAKQSSRGFPERVFEAVEEFGQGEAEQAAKP